MSTLQATGLAPRTRASRQAGVSVLLGGAFVAAALCVSAVQVVGLRQDKVTLERSVSQLQQHKDELASLNRQLEQTLAQRRAEVARLEQHKALLLQSVKELSPAPVVPAAAPRAPSPGTRRTPLPAPRKGAGGGVGGGLEGLSGGGGGAIQRPGSDALEGLAPDAYARPEVAPTPAHGLGLVSAGMARASADERPDTGASGKKLYEFAVWLDLPAALRDRVRQVSYTFDHPTFLAKRHRATDAGSGFRSAYTGWGCLSTVSVQVEYRDGTPTDQFSFDQCALIVATGDSAK
jgi:hypothetical protein